MFVFCLFIFLVVDFLNGILFYFWMIFIFFLLELVSRVLSIFYCTAKWPSHKYRYTFFISHYPPLSKTFKKELWEGSKCASELWALGGKKKKNSFSSSWMLLWEEAKCFTHTHNILFNFPSEAMWGITEDVNFTPEELEFWKGPRWPTESLSSTSKVSAL